MKIRPYYTLFQIGDWDFFVRNQWHKYSNGGFSIIRIDYTQKIDRNEFCIDLIGFSLVIMFDKK